MSAQCRAIVLGLDGAPHGLVERYIADGTMPFLAELAEAGAWGCLRSSVPPVTPVAWTSMFSGVNPGKHGIFGWQNLDPRNRYATVPVHGGLCRAPRVWDYFAARDLRSGLVGVPCTYPPDSDRPGFTLPGMDAPGWEESSVRPAHLLQPIIAAHGAMPYPLGADWVPLRRGAWHLDADQARGYVDRMLAVTRTAMEACPVDVLFLVFGCTDHVGHFFSAGADHPGSAGDQALRWTFAAADAGCRRAVELWGQDGDVLVVSDHGMAELRRFLNLSQWLQQNGYTKLRSGVVEWLKTLARLTLNERTRKWVKRLQRRTLNAADPTAINPAAAQAFLWGAPFPFIQLNVAGREPRGIIARNGEFEELQASLKAALEGIRDPQTDQAVFRRVFLGDELFSGPFHAAQGPDLAVELEHGYGHIPSLNAAGPMAPPFLGDPPRSAREGGHTREGVYFAAGPRVAPRGADAMLEIHDVAAILLTLLGIEVPESFDGRAPEWVRAVDDPTKVALGTESAGTEEAYGTEDVAVVEDRLRQLGYL
ncbi:MAG: hypothetical protein FJX74_19940 [Armatimonadetes bacterium]|nr:hypothetical protein [Armatimonadota bacterium]